MSAQRVKGVLFLFTAIVFSIAACKPEDDISSPLNANVSEVLGAVEMKQPVEQDFSPAQTGAILEIDGQVQTGDNGKARLDLSTGTIVRVSPSSLFTLVSNTEADSGLATNLKLELGRVFIILSGGSMEVETPSGVASVRGSYMMVEVDPNNFNVLITCLEGNCSASNQAGTVNFTAGEKTVLFAFDEATGQFLPPTVEPMNEEDYKKWLDENPEAAEIINQVIATMTAMATTEPPTTEPPPTEPPATEPPATEAPIGGETTGSGSATCFDLIEPVNDSDFGSSTSRVDFSWEEQPGATKYVLEFTYPNGYVVQFETTDTAMTRYVESMPAGGEYKWNVTAYDETGTAVCTAESKAFTKAEEPTWQEQQGNKKDEEEDEQPPASSPTEAPPTAPPPPTEPVCDPCDPNGGCFSEDPSCFLTQVPQ